MEFFLTAIVVLLFYIAIQLHKIVQDMPSARYSRRLQAQVDASARAERQRMKEEWRATRPWWWWTPFHTPPWRS
jgi:hypothetical protein